MGLIAWGFLASLAAGLATAVGALPVLFGHTISLRTSDVLLGFAAGVMLAASFFSLIIPGHEAARDLYPGALLPAAIIVLGVLAGGGIIAFLNEALPHEHFFQGVEGTETTALARVWLFVIAITLHNFPEGLAVGVGFGGGNIEKGLTLATGIGLQNAPEGLAVALALAAIGYSKGVAVLIAAATGLVEPVSGLAGAYAVSLSAHVLPWGMAAAAGAMIYVISHEIIPESHRHGAQDAATLGLMAGLAAMMFLDIAFT
jgi:ZIP family zinc transporter